MSTIQAKNVAGYLIMPGIIPRLKGLFTSGFGYIAFLMAQIYAMVRLLPPQHEYLNPQNIGKFNIRNVIAQAANHLVLKKENIDQMIIFTTILVGIVILFLQIGILLFSLIFEPALASFPTAAHPTSTSIFITRDPTLDIAFMLLDQVFGVGPIGGNQFFNSCIAQGVPCGPYDQSTPPGAFPWPFHTALHNLFQFYNTGILVIGALIFLYFVLIVVGETAVTGTPFGQRFQNVWVPIRLVAAIGLLIPLNYGYNSGQYITLFAGKIGSSFATNSWILYNNTIREHPLYTGGAGANPTGERESLIGKPAYPDITPVIEAMSIIHTCAMSYWYTDQDSANTGTPVPPDPAYRVVYPYLVKSPAQYGDAFSTWFLQETTTYERATEFFNNSDIIIRFGHFGLSTTAAGGYVTLEEAQGELGNVIPKCGDIRIPIKQIETTGGSNSGPVAVQRAYFELIKRLWFNPSDDMRAFAFRYAARHLQRGTIGLCDLAGQARPNGVPDTGAGMPASGSNDCAGPASPDWRTTVIASEQAILQPLLDGVWSTYSSANEEIEMTSEILERGWAGAGIWYNKIAQVNGSYMDSVQNIPIMDKYPKIMRLVRDARQAQEEAVEAKDQFCPVYSGENTTKFEPEKVTEKEIARPLCEVYQYWNTAEKNTINIENILTKDTFSDAMNLIFGTKPLADMTKSGVKTHPLTQLTMLGRGLVDASVRNIAVASGGAVVGGLAGAIDGLNPKIIPAVLELILSTAFVGLTAGLVLYYIVPFLPFIYFFFAVASWVKSIFEAMVGVPLWALAHLRIDGEGLPGNSAANGYYLILEIFLRPILTVFGLVAATLIFTAQVRVLNFLWQIVTENLTGFNEGATISIAGEGAFAFKRSIIDEFFFTIIYAIIVYMMAIAAFKLIDKIPDNLLRWMGSSVSSFGDINQDSVDGLTRYAAISGATAGKDLAGGLHSLSKDSGQAVGGALQKLGQGLGR